MQLTSHTQTTPSPPPVNILIVDDQYENILALENLISADDVVIHGFSKIDDALVALIVHDFALAILDVQMPEINGFNLAKLIRGIKRYSHLPIIFVTAAQNNDQMTLEAYESGAVDFLYKPLSPPVVRGKVRTFVELQQQKDLQSMQLVELKKLRIKAEAANLAKSLFLANISHEIRTPLSSVMGFAELIAKGEIPLQELDNCENTIKRNGHILLRLIDDILDLSSIETNKLEIENSSMNLVDFFDDIESSLAIKSQTKGIEVNFNYKGLSETHNHLFDPIRFKQILLNVIGNAIKFTSKGNVDVFVVQKKMSKDEDVIEVLVKDQGIGIEKKNISKIFTPFTQADTTIKKKHGGTGLGLAISKKLALAMGGDITIVSTKVGVGSVFEIKIPLKTSSTQSQPEDVEVFHAEQFLKGKKILVVDDVSDNLLLVEIYLRSSGAELKFASDGLEAISMCKKENFDLVLMDIQMPNMDGIEATKRLRKTKLDIPIIALTALASYAEEKRCIESGCNKVLSKPIDKDDLLNVLHRSLS